MVAKLDWSAGRLTFGVARGGHPCSLVVGGLGLVRLRDGKPIGSIIVNRSVYDAQVQAEGRRSVRSGIRGDWLFVAGL